MEDVAFETKIRTYAAAQFKASNAVDFYRLADGMIYAHFVRVQMSGPKRIAGYTESFHLVTGCCHAGWLNSGPVIVCLARNADLKNGTRITATQAASVAPGIFDFLRSLDAEQVARLILDEETKTNTTAHGRIRDDG